MPSHYSKRIICLWLFFISSLIVIAQNPAQTDKAPARADSGDDDLLQLARRARAYWDNGDYTNALPLFEKVFETTEKALGKDSPELPRQLILLATIYNAQGDSDRALSTLKRSLGIAEKMVGTKDYEATMTATLMNMGLIYKARQQYPEAAAAFERSLAIQEKASELDRNSVTASLNALALISEKEKDYGKAIALLQRSLGISESTFGTNSTAVGIILFRLGILCSAQGDFEKALPYLERSLKLTAPLPDDEPNLVTKANLYWGLGMSYKSLLKHEQAIQAFNQSLKLKEKLFGADDPSLVEILITVAGLHDAYYRPLDAIPLLERALAISEKTFGLESAEVATVLASLGNTRIHAAQFEPALVCLERSLQIREKKLEPTDPEVAAALHNLGSFYTGRGDYPHAIPLLERGVGLLEKSYMPGDGQSAFQFAGALNNLGTTQLESGNYDKGIATLQRSLAVTESAFGSASINLASTLSTIAVAYHHKGDFEQAFPLLERAMRILENAPTYKKHELVDGLNNLAELYRDTGDEATAMRLFNRSLEVAEKQFGSDYISLAFSLNGLALIYQKRGDASKALGLFERSQRVLEKNLGDSHPSIASVLINISALVETTGDTNRALSTLQRALAIQEKTLPPGHPDIAVTLNNLGVRFNTVGKLVEAQELHRKSLALTDAVFGPDNPESCTRLENLGIGELLNGDGPKGLGEFVESTRRWRRYLASQTLFQQSPSASRIQEKVQSSRDWFHSLCGVATSNLAQATAFSGAEQLAFGKALLEEIETVRARLTAGGRVQVQALREQADSIRIRIEAIAYQEGTSWLLARTDWRNSERDKLEHDLKVIEERITAASELVALTIREGDLSLPQIARSLPPDTVLVDFVQYRRADFTAGNNQWKEQRYVAYLTFSPARDSTNVVVERVDLGEAAPIDAAVELVCKRMSAGQFAAKDLPMALQQLSQLVYAPLAPYLANVSHLIVSPDGQLSRLPFEMLVHRDKYLLEEKTISYVTSGREVARIASESKAARPAASPAFVIGDPDFDLDLGSASAPRVVVGASSATGQSTGNSRTDEALFSKSEIDNRQSNVDQSLLTSDATRSLSRSFRSLKFKRLPGTADEARTSARLLGHECVLRLGAQARERELKSVRSPRVLHLATHGFFLSDQEFKHTNSMLSLADTRSARRSFVPPENRWENPMVRCGIALAGANHAQQVTNAIAEDGLLTGLEASLLNLQGTELVILSACDTGSGEVKIGEGVMSLRRAFRIAGAETVLASHWKVSDKATSQLMTEFMRRWRAGEPRAKAWREAQLSLLHSKEFSSPYFWAAFTLTGQWK